MFEETSLRASIIKDVLFLGVNHEIQADVFGMRVGDEACTGVTSIYDHDREFSELRWFHPDDIPYNTYDDAVEHVSWFLNS